MSVLAIAPLRNSEDRAYISELYTAHYGRMKRVVQGIVADEHAYDDIIIETMMALFSRVDFLRSLEAGQLVSYLCRCARNRAIKHYNAQKGQNAAEYFYFDTDTLDAIIEKSAPDPAEALLARERYEELGQAIASLPQKDKQLLYCSYVMELNTLTIAIKTGNSSNTIRKALYRARMKAIQAIKEVL